MKKEMSKPKKYAWKYGCTQTPGISAQIVGEEIEKLEKENEGALLPSTIVRAAKPKNSKLHPCFEWDNRKAADAYRENQARELLRKITIVYIDDNDKKDEIRAFHNIKHENNESYYTSIERVVNDEELQENVLDQIKAELIAIKRKYKQFQSPELQKIWELIDELVLS